MGLDPAWIGLIGALGGSFLTAMIGVLAAWRSDRRADVLAARAEARELDHLRRDTYVRFLAEALDVSNKLHEVAVRTAPEAPTTDDLASIESWGRFNETATSVLFLLRPEDVPVLYDFESTVVERAHVEANGEPVIEWQAQIEPIVAAMRRSLRS